VWPIRLSPTPPARLTCHRRGGFAATAQPVDWSNAETVRVEMVENRFIPKSLRFRHGVPYRLHLENHGKELHEFTAPQFFAAATVRDPRRLANGGKDVVLQSGTSAEIDLLPLRPGHYELTCADHDWDGMIGAIDVE